MSEAEKLREQMAKVVFGEDNPQIAWGDSSTVREHCREDAERILHIIENFPVQQCAYCGKEPDGAMLTMGNSVAHATCVIRKLNELLDPDYEGQGEPTKTVDFLSSYELVQLEVLGDEELLKAFDEDFGEVFFDHKPTEEEIMLIKLKLVSQETNAKNKAKGQLYRRK